MIHEEPEKAALVDADLVALLEQIDSDDEGGTGEFANTLVILFSDHGARMGKARLSIQVRELLATAMLRFHLA